MSQYRILDPLDVSALFRSLQSPRHSDFAVLINVSKLIGKKERLGKAKKIKISVTEISNDKSRDGMILVEGICLSTKHVQKFRTNITGEVIFGGRGLMNMPCK